MRKVSTFSVKKQMWMWISVFGGDAQRRAVQCHVKMWAAGNWGKKDTCLLDIREPEGTAQQRFIAFVGTAPVLEYGAHSINCSVDGLRLNSWLACYNNNPLPFYNLGLGLCFVNNPQTASSTPCLFGPAGVATTPDASLSNITDKLFFANGKRSEIQPYMQEVETKENSQEELDVQRLLNVFFVVRKVLR